jgi:hypothetical protein
MLLFLRYACRSLQPNFDYWFLSIVSGHINPNTSGTSSGASLRLQYFAGYFKVFMLLSRAPALMGKFVSALNSPIESMRMWLTYYS